MIKVFLLKLSQNIHWIFFVNFFSELFDDTVNKILFWLDIFGWILSLFPCFNISPIFILSMNMIVFSYVIVKTLNEKEYKRLVDPKATLLEHTYHINGLALSSDEKLLASCGGDNYAILWDNLKRKVLLRIPHDGWVGNVSFSPDNQYLYSLKGKEGLFSVWNCETGILENKVDPSVKSESRGLAIFPDNNQVMVSSKNGNIRYFAPLIKNPNQENLYLSEVELRRVNITGTNLIASGSIKGEIFLIKATDKGEYIHDKVYQDSKNEMIRNLVFNKDGSRLAFTDSGGYLKVMNVKNYKIIFTKAHNGHAIAVEFSPNGNFIASGGQDNVICIWELKQDVLKKRFEIRGHTDDVTCLLFDSFKHLYSASRDGSIKIWNMDGLY